MAKRGLQGSNRVQIPELLDLPIPFEKANLYFAKLQNVELTEREADGDYANLQQVAFEKRRGTALYGSEMSGVGKVHSLFSYSGKMLAGSSPIVSGIDSGTSTGGTTSTLEDTTKTWTIDEYADKYLTYTTDGQERKVLIKSNTATSLVFMEALDEEPTVDDSYYISEPDSLFIHSKSGDTLVQDQLAPNSFLGGSVFSSYTGTPKIENGNTQATAATGTSDGVATGGTVNTLVVTGAAWTIDDFEGKVVKWVSDTSEDFFAEILSNTADTLTFTGNVADSIKPVADNAFIIYDPIAPAFTGTWTADGAYNATSEITQLTDTTATWKENELVGLEVYINQTDTDEQADRYTIVQNTATTLWVNGAVAAGVDTKKYKIVHNSYNFYLQDTNLDLADNEYSGKLLVITDGRGKGQVRDILGNSSSTFSIVTPWNVLPDVTTQYAVYDQVKRNPVFYFSDGYKPLSRYDGDSVKELSWCPAGQQIIPYSGRSVITRNPLNKNSLWYSESNDYEYFPPQNIITPPGDDDILGCIEWNKILIIFKENSVWQFTFSYNDATQTMGWNLDEIPDSEGCLSARSIIKNGDYIWYLGSDYSIRRLGASPYQLDTIKVVSESFFIDHRLATINPDMVEDVVAYSEGDYYFLSCALGVSTYNDFIFVNNAKYNKTWTTRTGNDFLSFVTLNRKLYAGGSNDGYIRELNRDERVDDYIEGELESGVAIDEIISEKLLNMGSSFYRKKFEFQQLAFENTGATVTYHADIFRSNGSDEVDGNYVAGSGTSPTGPLASTKLGAAPMGGAGKIRKIIMWQKSISKRGYHIQTQVSNNNKNENMVLIASTHWYTTSSLKDFPIANKS